MDSTKKFNQTPPGSPKSCMKGSRKINFSDGDGSEKQGISKTESIPKTGKSAKSVVMKDAGTSSSMESQTSSSNQPEISFQFELSEHFDNPPPPPNCTSNGAYEEERIRKQNQESPSTSMVSTPEPGDSDSSSSSYSPKVRPMSLSSNIDPQILEIATTIVNEIIEKAKAEVVARNKKSPQVSSGNRGSLGSGNQNQRDSFGFGRSGGTPWYRRAHGVVSKWVTNLCVRAQNAMKN